jgi:hypothetical protein
MPYLYATERNTTQLELDRGNALTNTVAFVPDAGTLASATLRLNKIERGNESCEEARRVTRCTGTLLTL